MNEQTIKAEYRQGVFKPITPVKYSEGEQVELIVRPPRAPEDVLQLAAHVFEGLTENEVNEIEQIALNRRDFFGDESNG